MTIEDVELSDKKTLEVKSAIREIVETILLTLLIFFAVRAIIQNFKVEGSSMEPSLHTGQYLLVNKAVYYNIDMATVAKVVPVLEPYKDKTFYLFHPPQRGEVVVFRFPKDPSRDFIKRIIAVPDDVVEIRGGKIYVNGETMVEPYIQDRPNYPFGPERVPKDNYFVLGDNRNNSSDSHVWGMVPRDNIIGKAWVSYWPTEDWGFVTSYSMAASGK